MVNGWVPYSKVQSQTTVYDVFFIIQNITELCTVIFCTVLFCTLLYSTVLAQIVEYIIKQKRCPLHLINPVLLDSRGNCGTDLEYNLDCEVCALQCSGVVILIYREQQFNPFVNLAYKLALNAVLHILL